MARQVTISSNLGSVISGFTEREKANLVKAIDLMESIGRIGEPLFLDMNVWKYRVDNLRIIYRMINEEIRVIKIMKGINSTH
jgi:mRNA-degrading endonuclease RelE of RelBE toxin-antitoxin system